MSNKQRHKKIDLNNLPRYGNKINWKKSIGNTFKFEYDNIQGEMLIVNYEKNFVFLEYLGKMLPKISATHLIYCQLGKILGITSLGFQVKIDEIIKDKNRNLLIKDRKIIRFNSKSKKVYNYHCNICGYNGQIEEGNLLRGSGCSCCTSNKTVLGINTIWDTDRWMVELGISEKDSKIYCKSSNKKVKVICPLCSQEKELKICNIYTYKSINCICGDGFSYPNKFMFTLLKQFNIKFYSEKRFEWCYFQYNNKRRQGVYDFYFELNNKKYIIEMDGGFHYQERQFRGNTLLEVKEIDNIKDKLALENGIEVIRIDCQKSDFHYIKKNIEDSRLSEILDFSIVNWASIEEFCLSNLVKEASLLKKNNPDLTTTEIGNILKINRHTIREYLKKGSYLGWCTYSAEEEVKRRSKKSLNRGKIKGKDYDILVDDSKYTIYNIKTPEGSMFLGKNTKWCISKEDSFILDIRDYIRNNYSVIFILSKREKNTAKDKDGNIMFPNSKELYGIILTPEKEYDEIVNANNKSLFYTNKFEEINKVLLQYKII